MMSRAAPVLWAAGFVGGMFLGRYLTQLSTKPLTVPRDGVRSVAIYPGIRVTQMTGKPVTIVISPSFPDSEIACTEFQR